MHAVNTFRNVVGTRVLAEINYMGLMCNYMDNDDEDEFIMYRGMGIM
jgi:hypothetical protein